MAQSAKKDLTLLHALITVFLMFGFAQVVPPLGSITPYGMKILGIFIGLLYGWTASNLIWPTFLGMIALVSTGAFTMKEFFALSFGNETVVFLMVLFVFTGLVDAVGLIKFIANWFVSRKCVNGRPWVFSTLVIFGAFVAGGFINMFAALIVFWGIIYIVSDMFGFKPYDKYPTLMIFGIAIASFLGGSVMPYKLVPLAMIGAYDKMLAAAGLGSGINFMQYVSYSLPVAIALTALYILICRFVFRPDLKDLQKISTDFVNPEDLKLSAKQKTVFVLLIIFIFLMLAPGFLPKGWGFTWFINQIGIGGCVMLLLIVTFWLKFDGEPLMDFKAMAHLGMAWEPYVMFALILPFTTIFTSAETGISQFIVTALSPIFVGKPTILFILLFILIPTILTNIANNMVVGIAFLPILLSIGVNLGVNINALFVTLIFAVSLAFVTPAASPGAAIVFSNVSWLRAKDIYKYASIYIVIAFVFLVTVGLAWANIIF